MIKVRTINVQEDWRHNLHHFSIKLDELSAFNKTFNLNNKQILKLVKKESIFIKCCKINIDMLTKESLVKIQSLYPEYYI